MPTLTDTTRPDVLRDPEVYTVSLITAATILGISRTTAYAAARRGHLTDEIPVLRVSGKYTVSTAAIRRALNIELGAV